MRNIWYTKTVSCSNDCVSRMLHNGTTTRNSSSGNIPLAHDQIGAQMWPNRVQRVANFAAEMLSPTLTKLCHGLVQCWRCVATTRSWAAAFRTYLASYLWNTSSRGCVTHLRRRLLQRLIRRTARLNAAAPMIYRVSCVTMGRDFHAEPSSLAYTAMLHTAPPASR